jgi:phospho-N-acetylmuramoyl-pentapeptide-transferase
MQIYGTVITLGSKSFDIGFLYPILAIFVITGASNAYNLTDGLDGLASGVVAIIMTFFTIVAIKNGDTEMVMLGSVTVGTCIGFLMFNFYPARVFMGDTGSLALGGFLGAIALILQLPLILIIIAGICVIEALSDILQVVYFKLTNGKRIFKMAPLHHHLELSGWSEKKVTRIFYAITIIFCVIGILII